jgi:hypothetical protein
LRSTDGASGVKSKLPPTPSSVLLKTMISISCRRHWGISNTSPMPGGRFFGRITIHPEFRSVFLFAWVEEGDAFRNMIENDLVLLDLLHRFLPPYAGPAVELFRGETAVNRRRRTYGTSWSTDRLAAECFATDVRQACNGGSVLSQTTAPADAIICAPHLIGTRRPAEAEYIVDRRRLGAVAVVRRYAQLPTDSL